MNYIFVTIIIILIIIFFISIKKVDKSHEKINKLLYEDEEYEKAEKVVNSLVWRFFQPAYARYEYLMKIAFYQGNKDKLLKLIVKFSKILINRENDYKINLYWFCYYYLCEDYKNTQLQYNNLILNSSNKTNEENKVLLSQLKLIVDFHFNKDFFNYEEAEIIAQNCENPFNKAILYYESAFAYFKLNKIEKSFKYLEQSREFAKNSFVKDKIEHLKNEIKG